MNQFDLSAFSDHTDDMVLNGFFSKIKKAAKKKVSILKKAATHKTSMLKKAAVFKKDAAKKIHKSKVRGARSKLNAYKRRGKTAVALQRSKSRALRGKRSIGQSFQYGRKRIKGDKLATEKEIHRAMLGTKYGAKLDKFKASPEFQRVKKAVGLAVAAYFTGPLVGLAAGGTSLTGAIGQAVASEAASEAVKAGAKSMIKRKNKKHEARMFKQIRGDVFNAFQFTENEIAQLETDPEFVNTLNTMIKEGKPLNEIEKEWAQSNALQNLVRTSAPKNFEPMMRDALIAQGIPPEVAQEEALVLVNEVVDQEADRAEAKAGGLDKNTIFATVVPIVGALLMGG